MKLGFAVGDAELRDVVLEQDAGVVATRAFDLLRNGDCVFVGRFDLACDDLTTAGLHEGHDSVG